MGLHHLIYFGSQVRHERRKSLGMAYAFNLVATPNSHLVKEAIIHQAAAEGVVRIKAIL